MSVSLALVSGSAALGDEIARLAAHLDAATHRLLTCIRQFDESGEWATQGARSCAHWLSWRIGVDLGTAREQVRVARALGRFPAIDAALSRAQLSYAKARAITRVVTPEIEARLIEYAAHTTGAQLERICRRFRRASDEVSGVVTEDRRGVAVRPLGDGLVRLELTLRPDEAALVLQAIEKARDALRATAAAPAPARDVSAETRPASQDVSAETRPRTLTRAGANPLPTRADAAIHLAEHFLATTKVTGRAPASYQVFIHLDQSILGPDGHQDAFLEDGTRVCAEAFRRVSCDAPLVGAATTGDGAPLNVGRRTRAIPPAIKRALLLRDHTCRFPGCANARFVHAHHIRHWLHGGETSLRNLVTLCSFHHQLLHEGGFRTAREASGELSFFDPRGHRVPAAPAVAVGPPARDDFDDVVPFDCRADGERIDYDWAVDALFAG